MLVRLTLIVLALACGTAAASEEPGNQKTVATKGESAASPPTPVQELPAGVDTKGESRKDAGEPTPQQPAEKARIDRQMTEYTRQLAVHANALSKYAGDVSDFTFWLVFATLLLGGIGAWQGFLLHRTVLLARDEFTSTHRPRLILREAYAMEDYGKTVIVSYTIANIGDSAAQIVESALDVEFGGAVSSPKFLPVSAGKNDVGAMTLQAGERAAKEFKSKPAVTWPITEDQYLFLSGHVVYLDDRKVMRHMGFHRRYDPLDLHFHRSEGEGDYLDYAD